MNYCYKSKLYNLIFSFVSRRVDRAECNAERHHLILTIVNNIPQDEFYMHMKITRAVNTATLTNMEFKIYDATVAKTSLKIESSSLSIFFTISQFV